MIKKHKKSGENMINTKTDGINTRHDGIVQIDGEFFVRWKNYRSLIGELIDKKTITTSKAMFLEYDHIGTHPDLDKARVVHIPKSLCDELMSCAKGYLPITRHECPYCKRRNTHVVAELATGAEVHCAGCGTATLPHVSIDGAVKAWNEGQVYHE